MNRRHFLASGLAAAVLGCGDSLSPVDQAWDPRLHTAPFRPTGSIEPGESALSIDAPRDGRIYVPTTYNPAQPAPLMLGFHGAGGSGASWVHVMQPVAEALGVVLLAPDSRDVTWDGIGGPINQDPDFIDAALRKAYTNVNIDPSRIAMAGFSDGATYALTLGMANGDLFPKVIAMSPGFVIDVVPHGHPKFFIMHGTADTVLPIDQCSRRIVPNLRAAGYDVTYNEFDGGHAIYSNERDQAFAWMLNG